MFLSLPLLPPIEFKKPQGTGQALKSERGLGKFQRNLWLPEGADIETATAQLKSGGLSIQAALQNRFQCLLVLLHLVLSLQFPKDPERKRETVPLKME